MNLMRTTVLSELYNEMTDFLGSFEGSPNLSDETPSSIRPTWTDGKIFQGLVSMGGFHKEKWNKWIDEVV